MSMQFVSLAGLFPKDVSNVSYLLFKFFNQIVLCFVGLVQVVQGLPVDIALVIQLV